MSITNLIGVQSSASAVAANQKPDIEKILFIRKPYQYPIFQWLYFALGQKAEVVRNQNGKFDWFEDDFFPHQTELSGAGIAGGSASEDNIGVVDKTMFAEGDILFVDSTLQLVYVDSIASNEIDITSMSGANITAATSGLIRKVGSRNNEYSLARASVSTKEVNLYNYLTLFNESVTMSGRRQAGDSWTNGKTFEAQILKKVDEMKFMYERNFIYSTEKGSTTETNSEGTFHVTWGEGFLGRYTTNKTTYTTLTETALDEYLMKVSQRGNLKKMHVAGSAQIMAINKIVKDRFKVEPKPITTKYGIDLVEYVIPGCTLQIMRDPVLEGSKFTNWGITFDNEFVKMRYMANDNKGSRKFRIERNIEDNGRDGTKAKVLADIGIQLPFEQSGGILAKA